ncbi:glycosyltransferase family 9 protein [Psychroflexus sp. ALD_RP9]|uniref:glycosyltransferase family 9 protein n=1 Tax=Psychroflexus sp. ALD_RP9 TaxID=2777186 RepID=UPI001A8C2E74|nr:glycosyltransferase family 9 protein [Psychroflexus sp. ALD_RP9]QSS97865.1 glycosyltransferase family 9 protein [Psychroflexus sp. ALD_RP9]
MKSRQHLVLIRLSAMGDVAMTVPVVKAALQQNPNLKITIVTKAFFGKLFLHLPEVNVIEAKLKSTHKGIKGLWQLSSEISQLNPDYIVDLHNVLRSRLICGFLKLRGFDYRRFRKGRKQKRALTKLNSNKKLKALKSTHERYASALKRYKLKIDLSKLNLDQKLTVPNTTLQQIPFNLNEEVVIGIAPFAAHKPKQYPLNLLDKVITELAPHTKILLFGGGKAEVSALNQLSNSYHNCFSVAGKFNFEDELALISNLDLMLSMDSGNGHLAAMFGVKVMTVWVTTHPAAGFAPFRQSKDDCFLPDLNQFPLLPLSVYGNKMIDGYENVAESILPSTISERIKNYLNKKTTCD